MSESADRLTLDDLADRPWQMVIDECEEKTCLAYSNLFCRNAHDEADAKGKSIWTFLTRVATLPVQFDPAVGGAYDGIIGSFSDAELSLMKQLVPIVDDPEFRSRMADAIWMRQRKGNFPFVKIAVESYLESARRLEHKEYWVFGEQRVERACQLAFPLNSPQLRDKVIDYIKEVIERCNGEDPYYLSARLMSLLIAQGEGDSVNYAILARKLAESAEQEGDFHKAKEHWVIVAEWCRLASDDEAARKAAIQAAESHVKDAQRKLQQTAAPYGHAAVSIAFAIEAYRRIPGSSDRIAELHRLMLDYQQKSMAEHGTFTSGPLDLTSIAEEACRRIRGKSFHEAMWALVTMLNPTDLSHAREQVKANSSDFVLKSLLPTTLVNAMGRTIARQPSLLSSSPEESERAFLIEMFHVASYGWQINAKGVIDPARRQIMNDHQPMVRDFLPLVGENPFVPDGRQLLYARGLHAGLTGDFVTAMHFLIPQVEHSVRTLLYANGFVASGFDQNGIQMEFDINTMLKDSRFKPFLDKQLGESIVFDLRAILVEPFGANLRNDMAHGLLNDNQFYASASVYCWWLILRLCFLPFLPPNPEQRDKGR